MVFPVLRIPPGAVCGGGRAHFEQIRRCASATRRSALDARGLEKGAASRATLHALGSGPGPAAAPTGCGGLNPD